MIKQKNRAELRRNVRKEMKRIMKEELPSHKGKTRSERRKKAWSMAKERILDR
ncbi:MAG: hypothetical protein ACOCRO_00780 [Halanaerobiales bacterium]